MAPHWFRVIVARYVLEVVTSEELIGAADALLTEGIYSYSLGELATSTPPAYGQWVVTPRFVSALRELGIPLPSREEAARTLLTEYMRELAEGGPPPREALHRLRAWRGP